MQAVFFISALMSVLAVALICLFLFANGLPAMQKIGLFNFIAGEVWKPSNDVYGILPMILASLYVTAGAIAIGVPVGILTAVFLARFCNRKLYKFIKPAVELLAGIPSVVYGFFGLMVIVPAIRALFGGSGKSMLAACILLGIMILPTIISVSEASIRAVPESYSEGALALGAPMSAAFSGRSSPRRRRASPPPLSSASAGPSARRWPSSWWPATRPSCLQASSRASDHDRQHRHGDGYATDLHREALIRDGRGAVRIHSDHQLITQHH